MRFPLTKVVAASLLLLVAAALSADETKKCSASARECEREIRQMLSGRRYLGVVIVDLLPGVAIKAVLPDGPAANPRVDLKAGDHVIAVNGRSMLKSGVRDFKQALADVKDTGTLFMIVERRGVYRKVEVRLEPYSQTQVEKIIAAHLAQSHASVAAGSQP